MVGISVLLLLSFCIIFIFTRTVWIKLIRSDGFKLELHMPIVAVEISKGQEKTPDEKRRNGGKGYNLQASEYLRIISSLIKIIEHSRVEVTKIAVSSSSTEKIYIFFPFIYSFLAYFRAKAKKITIKDDAIVLSPDGHSFLLEFTVKTELYRFLFSIVTLYFDIMKEKRRKGEKVGK